MQNLETNSTHDSDFTFLPHHATPTDIHAADELFAGGFIRPLFSQNSHTLNSAPSESSSDDDLDGVPTDSYCAWVPPSPATCKKSRSTGSSLRSRMRDLVLGRSCSDGGERLAFVDAGDSNPVTAPEPEKKGGKGRGKGVGVSEMDLVTAHRVFYGPKARGRRSFLPYRPEIVGLFSSGNGLGRDHRIF